MQDIFFNKKDRLADSQAIVSADSIEHCFIGVDGSALKQSHLDKLSTFHHKLVLGGF
jgi:hypothetical protein